MNRRLLYVLLPLICLALLAGCQERSVNVDHHANATDDDQADDDAGSTPWDNEPARPLVTIQQPTPGEFFADATAPVSGEVTGVPVTQVFVNDQPVAVQDGHFQTTVSFAADQQVLPIYVLAKTDDGRFGGDRVVAMRGEMRAPEKNIDDALRVGLGDDVFTVIGAAVAQLFQNLDLGPIFASLNPIIDFLGITVDITAATIGGAQFSGEFTDQGLHIFGELTDVTLTADVTAFGNTSTTTITIGTLSLDMLADVLFKDGSVAVTVSSINAAHSDVTYDGPLPALLGKAGTDLLLGAIEGVVELLGRDLLPNLLSQWILTAVLDTVQIGFDIHAGLTSLDIGPGAAMAGLALNVFLTDPNPEPWPYGSLFTPGAPPDMLFARPPAAQSFGVALALSANFLNRFLFSAAEAELLNFAVGDPALVNDALPLPLTAGVLAGLMPAFGDIDPDIPATMNLHLAVPPVALAGADGSLTLDVPDYRVEFDLYPPGKDPWRAMTMSVALELALDLNVDAHGAIRVSFPRGGATVLILDDPIGESGDVPTTLADWITQFITPALDKLFALLPIQLPSIAGVEFDPLWLGTAGENHDYWTGYVGLKWQP